MVRAPPMQIRIIPLSAAYTGGLFIFPKQKNNFMEVTNHGIFHKRGKHLTNPCYGARRWPRRLGRDQPA